MGAPGGGEAMRFFLIDRVDELVAGERARGVKAITLADETLWDHFPGQPVFPGSLLIEAMAQLGGLLAEASYHAQYDDTRRALLAQVERAKFHAACRPGDQLVVGATLGSLPGAAAQLACTVARDGELAAQAQLTYKLVAIDDTALHAQRLALYRLWTAHLNPRPLLR
jgi:3-hydroxyacyl-[acyl-carrier-protein] dehydratase